MLRIRYSHTPPYVPVFFASGLRWLQYAAVCVNDCVGELLSTVEALDDAGALLQQRSGKGKGGEEQTQAGKSAENEISRPGGISVETLTNTQ